MTEIPASRPRPMSPHLQIYGWAVTMAMSVLHRATGIVNVAGTVLLAWWLVALASGPAAYAYVQGFFGSWFGLLVMFGYTWNIFHHMLGGIRHLIWDVGEGHTAAGWRYLSWGTLVGSVGLTVIAWGLGLALR